MRNHFLLLFAFLLASASTIESSTSNSSDDMSRLPMKTFERDGNIYCLDSSGEEIQITEAGVDSAPSLSVDQKLVTFVRENQLIKSEDVFMEVPATEIWEAPVDGSRAPSIVVKHDQLLTGGNAILRNFSNPVFSNDSSEIYFLVDCWVTSRALYSVKTSDSSTRFMTDANFLEVVRSGWKSGCIIVQKHKYFVGGGSYDWYWLISPKGETIGPLGEGLDYFKENNL
ncbi:hypothetical protein N9C81_01590 [Planctomycetota bacterium]|nr:hypothetical protein [Planctomycetota bacterium]